MNPTFKSSCPVELHQTESFPEAIRAWKNTLQVLVLFLVLLPASPAPGSEEIRPSHETKSETSLSRGLSLYFQKALKNSPGMRIAPVQIQAAEDELESLPVWYLPDIYGEAGYGGAANAQESRTGPLARLVADWTLWDGGKRESRAKLTRLNEKRIQVQSIMRKVDQGKSLGLLYLRICRLESTLEVRRSLLREYGQLEALLGPRLRIGTASYSDLVNVRIRRADLRSEIQDIITAMGSLREQLRLQAGLSQEDSVPEPVPLRFSNPVNGNEASYVSLEEHPLFSGFNLANRYFQEEEELARKEIYGMDLSLRLYGGYGPALDAITPEKPEAGAQIRFRIPVFGSGDRSSALKARKGRIEARRLEWEQALLGLKSSIHEKNAAMDRHRSRIRSLSQLIAQARRAVNIAYGDFRNGQKSPADMIASIDTFGELQMQEVERLFEWQLLLLEVHLLRSYTQDLQVTDQDEKEVQNSDEEVNGDIEE
ncbi:MAG: TolC family protein [Leptospiraceae bacterium]